MAVPLTPGLEGMLSTFKLPNNSPIGKNIATSNIQQYIKVNYTILGIVSLPRSLMLRHGTHKFFQVGSDTPPKVPVVYIIVLVVFSHPCAPGQLSMHAYAWCCVYEPS